MSGSKNADHLYLFLDEGGNFDFSTSGTKYFTLTTISVERPFICDSSLMEIKFDLIEAGFDIEYFHASEDKQIVRDQVFSAISKNLGGIRLDTLVVEKRKTHPVLQNIERFYPEMTGHLLKYVLAPINVKNYKEVVVITDKIPFNKKRKAIEKGLKKHLQAILPRNMKYRILHHESKSCFGLQVVDYCNWAIYRKWDRGDLRSFDLVKKAIKSEFDIFKQGDSTYY